MLRNWLIVLLFVGIVSICFKSGLTEYKFPELKFFPEMPVNADNPVSVEGIELGRFLFYDTILSLNRDISCASCHRQEAAFSDGPVKFSLGSEGKVQKRNTLPIFNLAWFDHLFWDGKSTIIEDQVFHPVRGHEEMNLNWKEAENRISADERYQRMFAKVFPNSIIDSVNISKAIAQFERSIISHNSKYDRVLRGEQYFTVDERAGFVLISDMTKGNCLHCHPTDGNALTTSSEMTDNGLDEVFKQENYTDIGYGRITGNSDDNGKFRVPSLRNLLFTAPYMHDGRFQTLEEVLDFYSNGLHASVNLDSRFTDAYRGGVRLSENERKQVILFLKTLTDSTLVSNPAFSNPITSN